MTTFRRLVTRIPSRPLVAALLLAFVASVAGVGVLATYDALSFGGSMMGGDTPLLIGIAGDSKTTLLYAYQPHGEVRVQVALANRGDLPVTLDGLALDDSWRLWFESVELRLPPSPTADILPLYPPTGGGPWYSEPFRPVELPPHSSTTLALVMRFADCGPDAKPMPTRSPGVAPDPSYQPSGVFGYTWLDYLPVAYSVGGIPHTARIQLPEAVGMVEGDPSSSVCAGASGRP